MVRNGFPNFVEGPTAELCASFLSGPLSHVLLNAYGPTEATVATHLHRGPHKKVSLPIGQILMNRDQAIIDAEDRLLPASEYHFNSHTWRSIS